MSKYASHIPELLTLVREAGEHILTVYNGVIDVEVKDDNSPVTQADTEANDILVPGLKALMPDVTVISEEEDFEIAVDDPSVAIPYPPKPDHPLHTFWLVDPLDGTKSFIKRTGEFTVNIGLIENGVPTVGVVYVPTEKKMYYTGQDGKAYLQIGDAEPQVITTRAEPEAGLVVVASKSHLTAETEAYVSKLNVQEFIAAGSSLKFCLIAEGLADIYPRFGPTMEWDTAAAHAVLLAAGGDVTNPDGSAFEYAKINQERPFLNGFFIASA